MCFLKYSKYYLNVIITLFRQPSQTWIDTDIFRTKKETFNYNVLKIEPATSINIILRSDSRLFYEEVTLSTVFTYHKILHSLLREIYLPSRLIVDSDYNQRNYTS